jgi:hypothetical protein
MDNFKELVKASWSDKSLFASLVKNKEFVSELRNQTFFMDKHYEKIQNKHRAYVVLNDIKKVPLCECGCGLAANLNYTYPEQGFRRFYNNDHSLKVKSPIITKETLYNERIVAQKSVDQIASDLKTSPVTIRNKLKEYGLDNLFDARQRNLNANRILQSKEELSALYSSGLKVEEVAEQLNTTKGTVSRWMQVHGIETRSSNSYERKIKKISKEENEIYNWLKTIYNKEIQQSNRSVLNGKELDLYLPEDNLAIEYNGLYSHLYRPWEEKECLIKGSSYHLQKTIECSKNGIQLLQFYSDEWKFKKEIVQNIIKSKLGLNKRLYARKCIVNEIDVSLKNSFLNQNHIQREDKSKIKLGLFYENKLVCVMTFCNSRFNRNYQWELSRFACLGGITVVGGFSKMLKNFIDSYGGSIVSYADRRISNGDVYKKNGFNLIHVNGPSYFYVDKNCLERHNRMKFQKKLIGAYDCSEYEKAREMGFEKIWDCGSLTYGLGPFGPIN